MIKRKTIAKDILFFGIPFFSIFTAGLFVCAKDGWQGFFRVLWLIIRSPEYRKLMTLPEIFGLGMVILGFILLFTSLFTLKKQYNSFLVIRDDHKLITRGIYRLVRHPIYLGVLMVFNGVALSATSLRGFLVMSMLIPCLLVRIRIEERLLIEEFGDAYLEYKKNIKTLIPFIF